jgi:hypothetical protein
VFLDKLSVMLIALFCRRCNFNRGVSAADSQVRQTGAIAGLMRALWKVNLVLVLNRSILNGRYILMNILKAFASIVSLCGLPVISLAKITPKCFTLFTNGMSCQFDVRSEPGGLIR